MYDCSPKARGALSSPNSAQCCLSIQLHSSCDYKQSLSISMSPFSRAQNSLEYFWNLIKFMGIQSYMYIAVQKTHSKYINSLRVLIMDVGTLAKQEHPNCSCHVLRQVHCPLVIHKRVSEMTIWYPVITPFQVSMHGGCHRNTMFPHNRTCTLEGASCRQCTVYICSELLYIVCTY